MGAVQGSPMSKVEGTPGPLSRNPSLAENTHESANEDILTSPAQSYVDYSRSFGFLWQAFRREGLDGELQPEIIHHVLRQADITPIDILFVEVGSRESSRLVHNGRAYRGNQNEVFASLPVNDGLKIRRIRVEVSSRDQGWVSDPDAGSWTWAELSWLDSDDNEVPALPRVELFRNELELQSWQEHDVRVDDEAFLQAQPEAGAKLALWVRSQFGGWVHYVRYASIKAWYKADAPWPGFEPLFRD